MSRKNLRSAEYRPEDDTMYTGLDIKGIRKIPELQSLVEKLVGQVQNRAPSLDRRPSFIGVRDPSLAQQHEDCEDGNVRKVKTPQSRDFASLPRSGGGQTDDNDTSSDDDCDEQPQPGYVFK